jgi:dienelactone hydrolase
MVTHKRPDSVPVELVFYPGVGHAFDVKLLQPGRRGYQNHWFEYNEPAAKDAKEKTAHSLPLISLRLPPASRHQSNTQVG